MKKKRASGIRPIPDDFIIDDSDSDHRAFDITATIGVSVISVIYVTVILRLVVDHQYLPHWVSHVMFDVWALRAILVASYAMSFTWFYFETYGKIPEALRYILCTSTTLLFGMLLSLSSETIISSMRTFGLFMDDTTMNIIAISSVLLRTAFAPIRLFL